MESKRKTVVCMAYVIVLAFVVSGFAAVVTLPRDEVPDATGAHSYALPAAQAHWDMSTLRNGKLQNLADPSGATDGTILNAVADQNGIIGGARDFNGMSASIESPDPSNLLKSDSGTVAAWIKTPGKLPETTKLKVAIVILECGGAVATQADIDFLAGVAPAATTMYSNMVHGNGALNISPTIFVQKAATGPGVNVSYPHLWEVNNFTAHHPDIYDYICFYTKGTSSIVSCMMNFKNTIHGIGEPYICTDGQADSAYITSAAILNGWFSSGQAYCAWGLVHELSHSYCGFWDYMEGGTRHAGPVSGYHYYDSVRTDMHSALGGFGWRDNGDGTWSTTSSFSPLGPPDGAFTDTEFNLDEYTIGLIPASEVNPTHMLIPALGSTWSYHSNYPATDTQVTIDQVVAAEGPWWNEEDRQAVMLRCTNQYGDAFGGQGWGLFVGTVAPNDHVFWYSGSADGAVEWRYGNAHVGDGAWHNIAVSWTGTTGKLYVDGVIDIQWTIHSVSAANNVHTVIGCEDPTNPYFGTWFNGTIDEVYVFNSVLTDAQVSQLYDSPPTTPGVPHLQSPGDELDGTFTLNWNASIDADQTPLWHYYLIESVNTGAGWSAWQNVSLTLTTNSIVLTRAPGSYIYGVCAGDTADLWSGWAVMSFPPAPGANPIVVPVPDSVPPVTNATLSGTAGGGGWYVSSVTVTLTATDSNGIKATYYKIDSARKYTTYTGPFQVTTDGKHTVYFYSVDSKGYTETAKSVSVWVDKTAPTTSATANTRKLTITLSASDGAGSGVLATYYKLDGGQTWLLYSSALKVTKGTHTIYYYSVDNVGNVEAQKSSTFTF